MTIRITQFDEHPTGKTVLRVEGKMYLSDARILEQTFEGLKERCNQGIEIYLTGVSFLDNHSALILMRLRREGATLSGLDFYKQQIFELLESLTGAEGDNL